MSRTLIVGGGLTGAALARLLQETKIAAGYTSEVVVWDRNSILGGRVMSRSFPTQREIHVDMGAQYWTPKSDSHDDVRQKLMQSGHLVSFAESKIAQDPYNGPVETHWVSPDEKGFRAMVEHFLEGTETKLSTHLESFQVLDDKRIQVTTSEGKNEIVNALVLTCPIPNVLSILKNSSTFCIAPEIVRALEAVRYSQRFAAAYVFDQNAISIVQDLGWTAKYVPRDESGIIRFVCWDHLKKQTGKSSLPALLVHTSVTFGSTFMDDTRSNDEILAIITKCHYERFCHCFQLSKMRVCIVGGTSGIVCSNDHLEFDRLMKFRSVLRISQVSVPFKDLNRPVEKDPVSSLVLCSNPQILVAGDSFLGSNFDSCLASAKAATTYLQRSFTA